MILDFDFIDEKAAEAVEKLVEIARDECYEADEDDFRVPVFSHIFDLESVDDYDFDEVEKAMRDEVFPKLTKPSFDSYCPPRNGSPVCNRIVAIRESDGQVAAFYDDAFMYGGQGYREIDPKDIPNDWIKNYAIITEFDVVCR